MYQGTGEPKKKKNFQSSKSSTHELKKNFKVQSQVHM